MAASTSGVGIGMNKYFAYDSLGGLELFDTTEKAKDHAQLQIDWFREGASEGWPKEVESVCWGVVLHRAEESTLNAGEEDDPKEYSDYYLDDIG